MSGSTLRRLALPLLLVVAAGLGGCAYYDPATGSYVPAGPYVYPAYAAPGPVVAGGVVVGRGCWNCGWRRPWGWRRW